LRTIRDSNYLQFQGKQLTGDTVIINPAAGCRYFLPASHSQSPSQLQSIITLGQYTYYAAWWTKVRMCVTTCQGPAWQWNIVDWTSKL